MYFEKCKCLALCYDLNCMKKLIHTLTPSTRFIVLVFVFIVGIAIGFVVDIQRTKQAKVACENAYQYVNKEVVCGKHDVIGKVAYEVLRGEIVHYISSEVAAGNISETSVYFRDLQHGPIFGIDDMAEFAPASLLKLPLALTYINLSSTNPNLLRTELAYDGDASVGIQTFSSKEELVPHKRYSIEYLLYNMIAHSDNSSYVVLSSYLANSLPNGNNIFLRTYQELGLLTPSNVLDNSITVRGYATIFRLLYGAAYLNEQDSELVLSWLAQSTFNLGLKAGVPANIVVAHKFGERFSDDSNEKQLHDCGIVYYPQNPYLLCIMTRGNDWNAQVKTIATISEMVYKEVDFRKLKK